MDLIFRQLAEKSQAAAALKITPLVSDKTHARPSLIVTVDTEEAFDWSCFDGDAHKVPAMDGIERFQSLCREEGAAPLYFLTWPILKDKAAASSFASMHKSGEAGFGLHLHQWTTPPGDFPGEYFSFQKNLPRNAYARKLKTLAEEYEEVFGEAPVAYRAGRYGVGLADYALLREAGIQYDFSPSAAFDFSARGGPDFSAMSNRPFAVEANGPRIFVTPVTGAKALRGTRIFLTGETSAPGFVPYRNDLFSRMKIPMRLSPEGAGLEDMQALTRKVVADGAPVLTFTLHSTSLSPGASPYAPDQAGVEKIMATSAAFLSWFRESLGGEIISFKDLQALYSDAGEVA